MPAPNRAGPGNLPAESTSFVGRRRLLADVKAAFANSRLITLVGPGGVGKTRLALKAAADLRRAVRDGIWFVDLAGLNDAHLVPKTVATSLGIPDRSGQWPTSLVIAHLARRETLVVLDNCEHLLDAVAVLSDVLLKGGPAVRLLATSREPLRVSGEHVIQVPPLSLDGDAGSSSASGSGPSEAMSLFVSRAADAGITIDESGATRRLVLELCRRLDGMPLALELAAVRLRSIGLEELIDRLNQRFAVLTAGTRSAPPRQKTLKATVDWSYDLLSDLESAMLRRLGVFASEFRLDAVEVVAKQTGIDAASVLDLLSSLVDKSFVTRSGDAAVGRYRLHETMRQYALLKLRESDEEAVATSTLVAFYCDLCGGADAAAQSVHVAEWFQRLDDERDNLRSALAHCLRGPEYAAGLSMVGSLVWYWTARAANEGGYWLSAFLDQDEARLLADDHALARALFARGFVAMTQGDVTTARSALTAAEAKARTMGDLPLVARTLAVGAGVHAISGDLGSAGSQLREAKALGEGLRDPGTDAALALTESFLALLDANPAAAGRNYSEWSPRLRERGDLQSLSYLLGTYGFSLLRNLQPEAAEPVFKEALGIERQLQNTDNIIYLLDGLACQAAMMGLAQRAARLLAAGQSLQARTGVRLMQHMEPLLNQARADIARTLPPRAVESELVAGRRMTAGEAIQYALEDRAVQRAPSCSQTRETPLSRREREIAALVADGLSNKKIASRLFLSERTVEKHVSNIFNRIGVNSRVELAAWVAQELRPA